MLSLGLFSWREVMLVNITQSPLTSKIRKYLGKSRIKGRYSRTIKPACQGSFAFMLILINQFAQYSVND